MKAAGISQDSGIQGEMSKPESPAGNEMLPCLCPQEGTTREFTSW